MAREPMSEVSPPAMADLQDAEIARYRSVSAAAVASLIVGLLSPLAMLDPLFWILPPLGILLSALALWQVAQNAPAMLGRKAALAGLTLSLLFAAAAPTNWAVYRYLIRQEARQYAGYWFEFLAQDQPHKAYQLTVHPEYRKPLDDELWDVFRDDPQWRSKLEDYVSDSLVRTMLHLGTRAHVRYCDSMHHARNKKLDSLSQAYAVTYDDAGEKKTFFVGMKLERVQLPSGRAAWYLEATNDGFVPEILQ